MIEWLRNFRKAIRDVIEIWRLVRIFQRLTDEQQLAEIDTLREIVKEERRRRQGQS